MADYATLPYERLVTFTIAGSAGRRTFDLVRDEEMGLGVPAKSVHIENAGAAGTITVGLSADGISFGRTIVLGPGSSRSYELDDHVRVMAVSAWSSIVGGQLVIGATPGEWTQDELNEYLARIGLAVPAEEEVAA